MDELRWYTYIAVFGSFALYFAIAWWARARSTSDFYVAGAHVGPVQNGMAIGADWMSAASFISMAGLIAFLGYGGSVFLMGWTGGYVLLAMLLAPYMRKHGKFTVPEFIFDRFELKAARVVAVICLIIASLTYIIGQMKGVGVAFSRFLEVKYEAGIYIGMGVVWFYAVLGGMKGITYTQVAQYCVLIFAFMVPAIFISIMLTNQPIPQIGMAHKSQKEAPTCSTSSLSPSFLRLSPTNGRSTMSAALLHVSKPSTMRPLLRSSLSRRRMKVLSMKGSKKT